MIAPPSQVYPDGLAFVCVLFDLREAQGCYYLHELRATWREFSDLVAFGPDHMLLILSFDSTPVPRR
jgi:hypothetical protein